LRTIDVPPGDRPKALEGRYYVAWKPDKAFHPRAFLPLLGDEVGLDRPCMLCKMPLLAGQVPALIPVGPGEPCQHTANGEQIALAALVHFDCTKDYGKPQPRP
jgi:hypothetical protein